MDRFKTKRNLAILQVLAGSVIISFSSVFVKLSSLGPTTIGFYRLFFGGLFLIIINCCRGRIEWQGKKHFWLLFLAGFSFAVDLFFWHRSINYVGPGLATILANLQVFFMVALGLFIYKERFNLRFIIALPLAFIGLLFLVGYEWNDLSGQYHLGVLFGVLTAICYTSYIFHLRKAQANDASCPLWNLGVVSLIGAAILLVTCFVQGEPVMMHSSREWLLMLGYGVIAQGIGWLLISKGLPYLPISFGGFLLLFQPSLSFVWDILFFHRPTPFIEIVGAAITLVAIYLSSTVQEKR